MAIQSFSKGEAVRFGWDTMKKNIGFFIILLAGVWLIYFILGFVEGSLRQSLPLLSGFLSICSLVLQLVMGMGLVKIALKFCDNEKGKFSDLFSCFPLFFKYLFGSILYGLIVAGGMLLLVVPGIIWAIKFQFFAYFIVDKKLGPIESLKRSFAITTGNKWDLFVFGVLLGLINLLGALCLLVGLFATIPTVMVAYAFVYRKLLAVTKVAQVSGAPSTELP